MMVVEFLHLMSLYHWYNYLQFAQTRFPSGKLSKKIQYTNYYMERLN